MVNQARQRDPFKPASPPTIGTSQPAGSTLEARPHGQPGTSSPPAPMRPSKPARIEPPTDTLKPAILPIAHNAHEARFWPA